MSSASTHQEGNVVQMQLTPGTQYIFNVPAPPPPPPSRPAPPQPSATKNHCSVCDYPFRDRHNLAEHMRTQHTVKEEGFACRRVDTYIVIAKHITVYQISANGSDLNLKFYLLVSTTGGGVICT